MHKNTIRSLIRVLLFTGSPSAVRWPSVLKTLFAFATGVMAIVIFPIKRMFIGRATPHVAKERLERAAPPTTDSNASPAIIYKARIRRLEAAGFDTGPRFVFGARLVPSRMTMRKIDSFGKLATQTSATNRMPSHDVASDHDGCISTIAKTNPSSSAIAGLAYLDHFQSSESLADEIDKGWHGSPRFALYGEGRIL